MPLNGSIYGTIKLIFLADEHPFPTPAAFLSYRTTAADDVGQKVQNMKLQIDIYLFYETFADTYKDSFNQDSALEFVELMDMLNALFHSTDGENYSSMRRLGFAPVDTGNAGNLYRISFECTLLDYSAKKHFIDHELDEISIVNTENPYQVD